MEVGGDRATVAGRLGEALLSSGGGASDLMAGAVVEVVLGPHAAEVVDVELRVEEVLRGGVGGQAAARVSVWRRLSHQSI